MLKLENKNIVLFGNAKSVFDTTREVDDKYDVICRCNAGLPTGEKKYLGSRTDILFLSLVLSKMQLELFRTKTIIWCSPKLEIITPLILKHINCMYSIKQWEILYANIKSRPSTGLMAFDYILQNNFKTLTLIGFDFWNTPNWYTDTIHIAQHNPKAEQQYIEQKIKEYNGRILL